MPFIVYNNSIKFLTSPMSFISNSDYRSFRSFTMPSSCLSFRSVLSTPLSDLSVLWYSLKSIWVRSSMKYENEVFVSAVSTLHGRNWFGHVFLNVRRLWFAIHVSQGSNSFVTRHCPNPVQYASTCKHIREAYARVRFLKYILNNY